MEGRYAFFVDGELLVIEKDEGERDVQYSMRVKFIIDKHEMYNLEDLKDYSRIHTNRILFNMRYPEVR